ncbi:Uncharacterised protein [Serratia grimesii]|jgi:hypothetical protein|uniref:hypothetical protein n=1 Tax=Serratia TaxID=613 RepID=UPI00076F381D|nr:MULTISPECIES: hypothetical protein [Serratia]ULG19270.1 hypothetical protein Sm1ap2_00160 [Serratia proteamaculans]CAI1055537.1 Uncharacterised protein [Serratia grimesii]CAI2788411.1 Uncharacterised protein [Serratia grimesii]CUW22801.1 Uncharacterised protein [Serratia grimesii]SMZ57815.1 Uncharacterised protein [Serratia grimesii]
MKFYLTLFLGFFSLPLMAAESHVCHSQAYDYASIGELRLSDDTIFTCREIGQVTIPGLAKRGWKVIHVAQQTEYTGDVDSDSEVIKMYQEIVVYKE